MEETYWKQFMTTGKVEDYLQFKGVSREQVKKQETDTNCKEEAVRNNPMEREKWM